MEKRKGQRIKDGAVVQIPLSENRMVFGRLLLGEVAVYDFVVSQSETAATIETIISKPILFYCSVYNDIITEGILQIIGFKELTKKEIDSVPPKFTQDIIDIDDCIIFFHDGRQHKASPEECIGLGVSSAWDVHNLVERIQDYYAGKKNFNVELFKPILSKDDPRYMPSPQALKWDFEKREFYRIDKQETYTTTPNR